jgi:hypothetical protein
MSGAEGAYLGNLTGQGLVSHANLCELLLRINDNVDGFVGQPAMPED